MGRPSKRQIVLCLSSTDVRYEETIHRVLPCSHIYSKPYGDGVLYAMNLLEKTYVTKVEKKMAELDASLNGCFMRFSGFCTGLFKTFGKNESRWEDVHFKTIFSKLNMVRSGVKTWESGVVAKKTDARKVGRSKVGLEEANQRLTNELENSRAENERLAAQLDKEKATNGLLVERLKEARSGAWQQELEALRAERAVVVASEKAIFDENLRIEKEKHKDRVFDMSREHYATVKDMREKHAIEIEALKDKVIIFVLAVADLLTVFSTVC